MLNSYLQRTQLLLSDPKMERYNLFDLTDYVNQARFQVAAEGRCIRSYASLALVALQRSYPFSAVTGLQAGVSSIYHIRQAWLQIPGTNGQVQMFSRPFDWFGLFALNNAVPPDGQPERWTQYGQGAAGSIFVDPLPDLPYTLTVDALGMPATLTSDASPEAIPDIWTLAVPFYAAWWALQGAAQGDAADKMMQRYQEQLMLARAAATPDLTPESWSQAPDAEQTNRLGVQTTRSAGG
jgi:hypothetical protein